MASDVIGSVESISSAELEAQMVNSSWDSLSGDIIKFEDHISILGFWGNDVINKKTEALNLNQKIYKRFYEFNDFQFVIVLLEGQEKEIENLKNKLKEGVGTDLIKWKFIFGNSNESAFSNTPSMHIK